MRLNRSCFERGVVGHTVTVLALIKAYKHMDGLHAAHLAKRMQTGINGRNSLILEAIRHLFFLCSLVFM